MDAFIGNLAHIDSMGETFSVWGICYNTINCKILCSVNYVFFAVFRGEIYGTY